MTAKTSTKNTPSQETAPDARKEVQPAHEPNAHRLYMQLVAFGRCTDIAPVLRALDFANINAVLYKDLNDPQGVGLLTFNEDADFFAERLRELLNNRPFSLLTAKPEYSMMGRTYPTSDGANSHEELVDRPGRTVINGEWRWAVWFPMRRKREFARLSEVDQDRILKEFEAVGRDLTQADHAHEVRLTCFGLDKNDNDLVIGLVGRELHVLSTIVERMRATEKGAEYLERVGPVFVGKAIWQAGATAEHHSRGPQARW